MSSSHVRLPHDVSDENMKASTQAYLGNGSSMYGRAICAGVCCMVNLIRKSMHMMAGSKTHINSTLVIERVSLAIRAKSTASIIR